MKILFHSSLLCLTLFLSTVCLHAQGSFSGGDGTKDNPYKISTEKDLRELAMQVNDQGYSFENEYLLQTADITFTSDEPILPIGIVSDGFFRPDDQCFRGTYDGGMHKIYNLNLFDETELKGGESVHIGVGLFGDLGSNAVVKNVVLASGKIYGFTNVGGIVGSMHQHSSLSHCKIGPDVRIYGISSVGGVAGSTIGSGMSITQCANYAAVNLYGEGQYKNAGGIIGSTANGRIEGCANFGDIYSASGFCGGIIGYMPLSKDDMQFAYPELKSCMNAGDITSGDPASGGLIGCAGYNISGSPLPQQQISNSYSCGQSYVAYSRSDGPIIAFFFRNTPITVSKTYYDADRYALKEDPSSVDSNIAFALGVAKTHQEIRSDQFIADINEGGTYPFEKDLHGINGTMPVLKWINDSYDAEIDNPTQYNKNLKPSLYKRRAGSFFPPNRGGDFLIWNMDMQQPNAQAKSIGCSIDRGWIDRVLSVKGGKTYTYFMSSSAFRATLDDTGMYIKPKVKLTANHWIITPEFTVEGGTPWFHWQAASEAGGDYACAYELYVVADENATTPEAFANLTPVYKTTAEPEIVQKEGVNEEGEKYAYFEFNDHKVDLSEFVGKKVRLAFRDVSTNKFNLLIGRMKMAQITGVTAPLASSPIVISVDGRTIRVSDANSYLQLYTTDGTTVATGYNALTQSVAPGVYILTASDDRGAVVETHKVVVR